MIPETDKTKEGKSPEDSLYTSSDLLIVADGVGGWSLQGVDSGVFSRELVGKVANDVRQSPTTVSLKSILSKAVKETKSIGSSTIAIT